MGTYNEDDDQYGNEPIIATTPFGGRKGAEQQVLFGIDPSKGLSKTRYIWRSNGTIHDSSLFTEDPGEITVSTTATGTDTARIQSAFAGQYVSQTLAEPGMGLVVDSGNVSYDADNLVSLSHGRVEYGPFWYGASSIDTGIALAIDGSGAEAVIRSGGSHQGDSPVPQEDWNVDPMDGTGPSGRVYRPDDGWIVNWPYSWYNQGPLYLAFLNNRTGELVLAHVFDVDGGPSLETPNLPVQLVVDNDGTASSLTAGLGGMQFSLYGASEEEVESRETYESRLTTGSAVSVEKATTENAIDPSAEPGVPLVSVQRQSGERDVFVKLTKMEGEVTEDLYVYFWYEWDPGTALTGATFNDVVGRNDNQETKLLTDTQATGYTPTDAVFIGRRKVSSGGFFSSNLTSVLRENKVPIEATLVTTAVHDGAAGDADPLDFTFIEGF